MPLYYLKKYSFIFKFIFCALILYFLASSDKLDFRKLSLFFEKPQTLMVYSFLWVFGILLMNSLRWHVLLRIVGVSLQKTRVASLTAIGLFFNSFLPGSVSGDAVKGYYIINENKELPKSHLLSSLIFDRLLGFYSIFTIASITILSVYSFEQILEKGSLIFPVFSVFIGMTCFFVFFFFFSDFILNKESFFKSEQIKNFFAVGNLYKKNLKLVFYAFFYSLVVQVLLFSYFVYLTSFFNDLSVSWKNIFVIYPLGIISTVIPIFPGGLGLGHASFEVLYQQFGLKEGANIFNLFFVGSLFFNMLGVFPYLFFKKGQREKSGVLLKSEH